MAPYKSQRRYQLRTAEVGSSKKPTLACRQGTEPFWTEEKSSVGIYFELADLMGQRSSFSGIFAGQQIFREGHKKCLFVEICGVKAKDPGPQDARHAQ